MTGDGLFHLDGDDNLLAMSVTPYEAEDLLQALLETHPDLLAGGQMTPDAPRRWALVKREQGVPDRDDAGYRWSVDHLFVDQDAVPTLVEVKRSTDTRIRREVVGQMLDYAANGVRYWPLEELRLAFEETQRGLGHEPDEVVAELTSAQVTVDEFFARVDDNLRAGRIRMVFVADVIPDELMRITEFLNEQMNPAEVFAVQVKQYRAEGYPGTVFVPSVYGRTASASTKRTSRGASRSREEALSASKDSTVELYRLVVAFAAKRDLQVKEVSSGSLVQTADGTTVLNFYLAPWDSLDLPINTLRARGYSDAADSILESLRQWSSKPLTEKRPNVRTEDALANWTIFEPVLDQIASLLNAAN